MTKTELKENITKINKLLRSDSYEAGIELIKTLDDPEITKGTLKTIIVRMKKILKQKDYDSKNPFSNSIDTFIELTIRLNEPVLFEALLLGCSPGHLNKNKIFMGSVSAQPYLDYAIWKLFANAPKKTIMDKRIKSPGLKINIPDEDWIIKNFGIKTDEYMNRYIDIFNKLPNITKIEVSIRNILNNNLDFLSHLTNLTSISLSSCRELNISDGKANFPHITCLSLASVNHFQNLDWLVKFPNLRYLHLSYIDSLNNIDGLINCKNLNNLGLYCSNTLSNVNILNNIPNLSYLNLYSCYNVNPKPSKKEMTTREEVAVYQEEIKKSMK